AVTLRVPNRYPEWYGAKGDGSTDDATALNKCFSDTGIIGSGTGTQLKIRPTVHLLSPFGYAVSSGITCPIYVNLDMQSWIIYTGSSNITTLTIGASGSRNSNVDLHIKVTRTTLSDWTSDDCVGVRIYPINDSRIYVDEAAKHTIGLQFWANSGVVYNEIHLGR
ncbi:MAG: hypothetical protein WC373_12540, partial [Smithella sp.]